MRRAYLLYIQAKSHDPTLANTDESRSISYVWGSSTSESFIVIQGQRLHVPASAERVLRRLRHHDKLRVVWIDAICINQNDKVEKGHQVAMMAEVYSHTCQNLVWLGEGYLNIDAALASLQAVNDDLQQETQQLRLLQHTVLNEEGSHRLSTVGMSRFINFEPLLDLFGSPWFRRLWVRYNLVSSRMRVSCKLGEQDCAMLAAEEAVPAPPLRLTVRTTSHCAY